MQTVQGQRETDVMPQLITFVVVILAVVMFGFVMWRSGVMNQFVAQTAVVPNAHTVGTDGLAFVDADLTVKVGETITLQLENGDFFDHSFDIDALDVHVAMPPKGETAVSFTPTQPGTYLVYCAVPGHQENGMVGELRVLP